jgi:tetratricopeptide (TPR) repeat protein
LGSRALRERGEGEAIPFFRHAIELDPEFALAYATLGRACEDVGEDEEAVDNYTKAFALRKRLSERDRYYVTTLYHETVTGDMEQAKIAGELWVRAYPRDAIGREKLGTLYGELGDFENASVQFREALRLDPDSAVNVFNAVQITAALNRWDEAIGILRSAQTRRLDGPLIREIAYSMAFLRHDQQEMDRQTAWGIGKVSTEEVLLSQDSDSKAYYGHLREARQLTRRAVAAASRDQSAEIAALCELAALLRETEVGIPQRKQSIVATVGSAPSRNVRLLAALVLARSGKASEASALANGLENTNPANTLVRLYWLPIIRAAIELHAGNPQTAISRLQTAAPYELAITSNLSNVVNMYPAYVRGQAYLSVGEGALAAAEFKRVLEHPGVAQNSIVSALSQLQLARAEIMMGELEAGRRHYSRFLSLWNTADDLPILRQARVEYRKIQ